MRVGEVVNGHADEFDAVESAAAHRLHQSTRLASVKDEHHVAREARQRGHFGARYALTVEANRAGHDFSDQRSISVIGHFVDLDSHPDKTVSNFRCGVRLDPFEFESEPVVNNDVVLDHGNPVTCVASIDQHRGG